MKGKEKGGCKLVNIQIKSETSKTKWLTDIATNPEFRIHLETFSNLVGVKRGDDKGKDLIFTDKNFLTRTMKINNPFCREALPSLPVFKRKKGIAEAGNWDKDDIFSIPSF